jgi:hypothetical protein
MGQLTNNTIQLRHRQSGSVLVIFALSLLIVFALAALTIDMAVMRLTQRQMHTATDSAAVVGLSLRDTPTDRRAAAQDQVSFVFDDDFNTASDAFQFGAGPTYNRTSLLGFGLEGGTINSTSVYDPVLQPNAANAAHGDMLSGDYVFGQRHDEGYNLLNPYERDDFPSGFDEFASPTPPNSFLVRVRRTRNASGLDNVAGVSSSGPSIPMVFGRGTAIARASGSSFDPRNDGFSFVSTSIADAQPTLALGPVHTPGIIAPSGIPGVGYFSLDAGYWSLLTEGVPSAAQILADGSIVGVGVTTGGVDGRMILRTALAVGIAPGDTSLFVDSSTGFPAPPFKARLADEIMEVTAVDLGTNEWTVVRGLQNTVAAGHASGDLVNLFAVIQIGDVLPATPPVENLLPLGNVRQFAVLYSPVAAQNRVLTFGAASIDPVAPLTPPLVFPVDVFITRLAPEIPSLNASSKLQQQMSAGLTEAEVNNLFALRNTLDGVLRSPALVLTR